VQGRDEWWVARARWWYVQEVAVGMEVEDARMCLGELTGPGWTGAGEGGGEVP
jgi:hypothetical protein